MTTIEYIKETLSYYYSVRSIKALTRPNGALYGKFSYLAECGNVCFKFFVICNSYVSIFPTASKMMQYMNNNKI